MPSLQIITVIKTLAVLRLHSVIKHSLSSRSSTGTVQKGEELCSGIQALIKEQPHLSPPSSTAGLALDFQQSMLVPCSLIPFTPNTHTHRVTNHSLFSNTL